MRTRNKVMIAAAMTSALVASVAYARGGYGSDGWQSGAMNGQGNTMVMMRHGGHGGSMMGLQTIDFDKLAAALNLTAEQQPLFDQFKTTHNELQSAMSGLVDENGDITDRKQMLQVQLDNYDLMEQHQKERAALFASFSADQQTAWRTTMGRGMPNAQGQGAGQGQGQGMGGRGMGPGACIS